MKGAKKASNKKPDAKAKKALLGKAAPSKKGKGKATIVTGANGKPARKPDQPKKVKLRDQKFIPVPPSAAVKDDDEEDEESSDGDHGMVVDGDSEEDSEEQDEEAGSEEEAALNKSGRKDEQGLGFLKAGKAGFLTSLDAQQLSRSKKETERLHQLQKTREPLPKPTKRARSASISTVSTVSSMSEDEDEDEDMEDDSEGALSGSVNDEDDEEMGVGGEGDEDQELEAGYSSDESEGSASASTSDSSGSGSESSTLDANEVDSDDEALKEDNLRQRARKRAKLATSANEGDMEASYHARQKAIAATIKGKSKAEEGMEEVSHLPIKLPSGEIQHVPGTTKIVIPSGPPPKKGQKRLASPVDSDEESGEPSGTDSDDVDGDEEVENMASLKGRFGRMSVLDVVTFEAGRKMKGKERAQMRLGLAKEQIAKIGAEIMGGGELIDNVPLLTRMSTFALPKIRSLNEDEPPIEVPNSIRGLALLSQLAVYKDLIPGYRIRELTEAEQAEKVREEVRRLREGEKGLVKSYKQYLKMLEAEIKQHTPLESLSLKCMSDLLKSAPHFNFAENVMGVIVGRLSKRSWDQDSEMCLQTIITVFRNDNTAKYSSVLLRLIARMIKERHYKVHPNVLSCLLHLRLRGELGEARDGKKGKGKGRASDADAKQEKVKSEIRKQWMTKNKRKAEKERREVEKELEEAEAEVDTEERAKVQTETLKNLFVLYFSILKQVKRSPLLPAALEGLSKFAHLVNIEFFRDLLAVLKGIIAGAGDEDLDDNGMAVDIVGNGEEVRLRMLGIVTAFELLSGQGEALNIDLNDFIVQLYALLLPLSLDTNLEQVPQSRNAQQGRPTSNPSQPQKNPVKATRNVQLASTADLLFRCLHLIFFSRHSSTANSPPWRAAAFAKRLLECSLHLPPATALKAIEFVRQLFGKEPKLEALLSTDDRTVDGVYRPEMEDPQLCNPFGASFWELGLLTRDHWDENVRAAAEKLAHGRVV